MRTITTVLLLLALSIYANAQTNMTPTAVYDDSGSYTSYTPDKSIDGLPTSFWMDIDSEQHSITYDLGETKQVSGVNIYIAPYRHCCVDIYIGDDPANLGSPILEDTRFDQSYRWNHATFPTTPGRYLRLEGLTIAATGAECGSCPAADTFLRLYEVEAVIADGNTTSTTSTTSTSTSTTTTLAQNNHFTFLWKAPVTGTYDEFLTPIYDKESNLVYVGSRVISPGTGDQKLYAVNADDGSIVWSHDAQDVYVECGVIAGDVICHGNGNMTCLDKYTGSHICHHPDENGGASAGAYSDNGLVYFMGTGGSDYVMAMDPQTCDIVRQSEKAPNYMGGSLCMSDVCDLVCFAGNGGDVDGDLFTCYDRQLNKLWGDSHGQNRDSSCVIDDSTCTVYHGSSTNYGMYAYSQSGQHLFTCPAGSAIYSTPAVSDGVLYYAPKTTGKLYAVNVSDPDSGEACSQRMLWTTQMRSSDDIFGGLSVAYGNIYVSSRYTPYLRAYDAATGQSVGSINTASSYGTTAVANGVVYHPTDDYHLYALAINGVEASGEEWPMRGNTASRMSTQSSSQSTTTSTTSSTSTSSTTSSTSTTSTVPIQGCAWISAMQVDCGEGYYVRGVDFDTHGVLCCRFERGA